MPPFEPADGVFNAGATIPAGRPLLAISGGIMRKVAYPTRCGRWVLMNPSSLCPRCGPKEMACIDATRDEVIDLLRDSLKPALRLI